MLTARMRPQQRAFLHNYKNEVMKYEKRYRPCQIIGENPLRFGLDQLFAPGVAGFCIANGIEKHFPVQEEKGNSFLD